MEIERKFLVTQVPSDLNNYSLSNIEQYYLSYNPEVRIRNKNNSYKLTIKSEGLLSRKEIEKDLSKNEYNDLKSLAVSNPIKKKRYIINQYLTCLDREFKYELDIYEDMNNLITVEVEFLSEKESEIFHKHKPDWFEQEVTYIKEFKNKELAKNMGVNNIDCYNCKDKDMDNKENNYNNCHICKGVGIISINDTINIGKYNEHMEKENLWDKALDKELEVINEY